MGFRVPRVQVVPLPDDQVSFRDAGVERPRMLTARAWFTGT
jgi:hypothetical protein